ncbi:23S rRNA (pseudouridine(1915)-N(3))-methyltransferase RlmH [Desulfovibrionales bacterium]
MYRIRLITVGRMKKGYWLDAVQHYQKMLQGFVRMERVEIKDCAHLPSAERKEQESVLIMQKITPKDRVLALHEHGRTYDSPGFAALLRHEMEHPAGTCCLVVGGALGISETLLRTATGTLSLSPMTMPHELAQVVLYEQLYRAMTILAGRPYHY